MQTLKAIVRVPLLLLILWIGSLTAYQVLSVVRDSGIFSLGWRSGAYALQGILEVVVLVWIYRWLERPVAVAERAE